MKNIRFDEKVAIITGAGGGLGRTYALDFAKRGARIVVNDLGGSGSGEGANSSAADKVVAEIKALGGEAIPNYDSVEDGENIVQTAIDNYDRVDIVINNAGILRDASIPKMPQENFDELIDVHLKGAFYVTQPAFRYMKKNAYGRVVYTSSAAGLFGNFGQANYAAAKMGLVGLSSVTAIEGAKYNIKSNVIAPIARTRLTEKLMGSTGGMFAPHYIVPMVAYLVSESCQCSHDIFNVGAGRYARIFLGSTPGWTVSEDAVPSAEAVRDNLGKVLSVADFKIPEAASEV